MIKRSVIRCCCLFRRGIRGSRRRFLCARVFARVSRIIPPPHAARTKTRITDSMTSDALLNLIALYPPFHLFTYSSTLLITEENPVLVQSGHPSAFNRTDHNSFDEKALEERIHDQNRQYDDHRYSHPHRGWSLHIRCTSGHIWRITN